MADTAKCYLCLSKCVRSFHKETEHERITHWSCTKCGATWKAYKAGAMSPPFCYLADPVPNASSLDIVLAVLRSIPSTKGE